MKKYYFGAVLTLACVLGIGVSARAQDSDAMVVTVPFQFVAGGATLPAGEYKVSRLSPGVNRQLAIRSYGNGSAFLLPLSFDEVSSEQPILSFEHVGDKYFLSSIKTLGGVYTLALPRKQIALAQTTAHDTMQISGSGTK